MKNRVHKRLHIGSFFIQVKRRMAFFGRRVNHWKIKLLVCCSPQLRTRFETWLDYIAAEVLAVEIVFVDDLAGENVVEFQIAGETVKSKLEVVK